MASYLMYQLSGYRPQEKSRFGGEGHGERFQFQALLASISHFQDVLGKVPCVKLLTRKRD